MLFYSILVAGVNEVTRARVIGIVLETQVYPRVLNAPEHCYKLVPPNTLSDRVDLGEVLDFE